MVGPDRCVILTLVLKIRAETKILARNGLLKKAAPVSHCGTGDEEKPGARGQVLEEPGRAPGAEPNSGDSVA